MKNSLQLLLALLLAGVCLLQTACETPLDRSAKARAKRVGVVSVLSENIHGVKVGMTAFGNRSYDASDPGISIDVTATQIAASALRPVFSEVVQLGDSDRALMSESRKAGRQAGTKMSEAARQIAGRNKLDMLLVIFPTRFDFGPEYREGVGVAGGGHAVPQSQIGISAFDGASGARLSSTMVFANATSPNEDQLPKWKDDYSMFTPEEREQLRAGIRDSLQNAITLGLRKMHITR